MKKTFDCVEMKNRIQKKMLEEKKRMGVEAMRRRREEWLQTGNDELAQLWRRLTARKRSATPTPAPLAREDESRYRADG